jgi:predicted ATPase
MTIVHVLATTALGLLGLAEVGEAHAAIDEALDRIARTDELWYLPEALRVKGEILRREGQATAAKENFERALECARGQGALSWELRIALNLAELLEEQGRAAEGRALLDRIYQGFTEGFDTEDLRRARLLLTKLSSVSTPRRRRPQARKRRLDK